MKIRTIRKKYTLVDGPITIRTVIMIDAGIARSRAASIGFLFALLSDSSTGGSITK
jgi:hypothetical protein